MSKNIYDRWADALKEHHRRPAYLMIADLMADAINSGQLQTRDRLPPLRDLAVTLGLNYATVTRGYNEAKKRGLIDSRPGMGSFIRGKVPSIPLSGGSSYEMTMNSPIEPEGYDIEAMLRQGALKLLSEREIFPLLRYQDFGGGIEDKDAGVRWLGKCLPDVATEQVLVCPGIHSVLVGLLTLLGRKGGVICVPDLVYPGLKAIAAQLSLTLHALECDNEGPLPRSFEQQCHSGLVSALYLNPTLTNPTALTIPLKRRQSLADIAARFNVAIIEDDAYAALPEQHIPSMAELLPELTWYVTGLSKCFGAGLRIAYVYAPSKRGCQLLAGAMRALTVMSSPISNALATQWINDDTADRMLAAIRAEAAIRLQLAHQHLDKFSFQADAHGFHLWLRLPAHFSWNPSDIAVKLREQGVSAVSSAAFSTDNNPPDAIRLCLGGSNSRKQCEDSLIVVADMLEYPEHFVTVGL